MKKLIIILFLILKINGFGQTDSPVGEWIMIEHLVPNEFNNESNDWSEKNIYNNEFKNIIIFYKNGSFKQEIGDSLVIGNWKLSASGKKLSIICDNDKWRAKFKKRIDFNNPILKGENLNFKYTLKRHGKYSGTSKFVRLKN